MKKCINCGAQAADSFDFCPFCGTAYTQTEAFNNSSPSTNADNADITQNEYAESKHKKSKYKSPSPKRKRRNAVIAAVFTVFITAALIFAGICTYKNISGGEKTGRRPVVYYYDGGEENSRAGLYYIMPGETTPVFLAPTEACPEQLIFSGDNEYIAYTDGGKLYVRNIGPAPEKRMGDERGMYIDSGIAGDIKFSDDNKYIFYTKEDSGLWGFDWENSKLIDTSLYNHQFFSDRTNFEITLSVQGSTVVYAKVQNNSLSVYSYNAKEKSAVPEEIVNGVRVVANYDANTPEEAFVCDEYADYYISRNFNTVVYSSSDNTVYVYNTETGSKKLACNSVLFAADPENCRILYGRYEADGSCGLWLSDTSGNEICVIPDISGSEQLISACFNPDSTEELYVSAPDGLYYVNPDTKAVSKFSDFTVMSGCDKLAYSNGMFIFTKLPAASEDEIIHAFTLYSLQNGSLRQLKQNKLDPYAFKTAVADKAVFCLDCYCGSLSYFLPDEAEKVISEDNVRDFASSGADCVYYLKNTPDGNPAIYFFNGEKSVLVTEFTFGEYYPYICFFNS